MTASPCLWRIVRVMHSDYSGLLFHRCRSLAVDLIVVGLSAVDLVLVDSLVLLVTDSYLLICLLLIWWLIRWLLVRRLLIWLLVGLMY